MIDKSVLGVTVEIFFLEIQSGISIRDGDKNLILETILSVFFSFFSIILSLLLLDLYFINFLSTFKNSILSSLF